ncbi:glycosyltransferase family protein, partial [Escherichia coli]
EYVLSLKRQGVKIVVDLDDFYQLNPEHYLASLYESNTHAIVAMVKLADVVIVTTEYLAYKIRHLNRNVVV